MQLNLLILLDRRSVDRVFEVYVFANDKIRGVKI